MLPFPLRDSVIQRHDVMTHSEVAVERSLRPQGWGCASPVVQTRRVKEIDEDVLQADAQRVRKIFEQKRFGKEPANTERRDAPEVVSRSGTGYDDDVVEREVPALRHLLAERDAIHTGQIDVHDHQVRPFLIGGMLVEVGQRFLRTAHFDR
jgi:hypothetical protein